MPQLFGFEDFFHLGTKFGFRVMLPSSVFKPTLVTSLSCIISTTVVTLWLVYQYREREHRCRRQRRRRQLDHPNSLLQSELPSAYEKLIGCTPLIRLDILSELLDRSIYVKMESLNPGGTGKDRAALCMIQHKEYLGELPPPKKSNEVTSVVATSTVNYQEYTFHEGCTPSELLSLECLPFVLRYAMKKSQSGGLVVEGTSGSTGISVATLCVARGHACLVVLPDDQAPEKKNILKALGATVLVVPTASISNPQHYVNIARRLAIMAKNELGLQAVFLDQFENLANGKVHFTCTGPEIYRECPQLDAFVMSAGTGGTIAGVASYLKKLKPSVKIVLVDPPGSALYHAVQHGIAYAPQQKEQSLRRHRYDTIAEGIGLDRWTANLREGKKFLDKAVQVTDQEAVDMAHYLLRTEGLWVGSSSAMNVVGAVKTASELHTGATIVTVICDSGQRHVTRFWSQSFIEEWGLTWPGDKKDCLPECLLSFHTLKHKI
jgi:cysteine synthase